MMYMIVYMIVYIGNVLVALLVTQFNVQGVCGIMFSTVLSSNRCLSNSMLVFHVKTVIPQSGVTINTLHVWWKMNNFLFVVAHAILWAFMEVEIEGTRGWMYDSQTQCSGIFGFTWYHIVMNILTIFTIAHINQYRNLLWTTYQILTWFIVEDVMWFVINGTNYRTAPWQTNTAAVVSTLLPFCLLYTSPSPRD